MKKFMVCTMMLLFVLPAAAETYTWVDSQGTANFTEDLGKVPKKYRKKAKIIGEEEPSPATVNEGAEKVDSTRQQPAEAAPAKKQAAPGAKVEKYAIYGGKTAADWKSEFAALKGELKAAEDKLVENRKRLQDTSGISRSEYLAIQKTLKGDETDVLGLRKKLDDLKQEAGKAEVPAEVME